MRQDSDQERQVEPNMRDWRLPDGKNQGGLMVKVEFWGPTVYSFLLAANLNYPKILRL